jgi:hypothetical protein
MKTLNDYIYDSQKPRIGDSVVISVNDEYIIESKITDVNENITIVMDPVTREIVKHAKANSLTEGSVVDFDRIGRYSAWGRALLQVLKWSNNPRVIDKHTTDNDIVLIIRDDALNQILEKEAPGITSNQIAMYAKAIPELDYQWAPKSKQHVITIPRDLKLKSLDKPDETTESKLTFENNAWHLNFWTVKPVSKVVAEIKQQMHNVLLESNPRAPKAGKGVGKMPLNYWEANPGSVYTADKYYDMYRASMLMGRLSNKHSDEVLDNIDAYSWINNAPMMVTYTPEEFEMAKKAFAFMGIPFGEHVPPGSDEPSAVNKVSPFKPFKGYKGTQRRLK